MENRTYIAIDLKSFYASVECRERLLDPLKAKLVVADKSRTSKTICLAVTPALKAYGLSGRSRLFEVEAKAREIKAKTGKELEYIVAPPRMALYIQYSTRVYNVYLKYFAPEDIHVYSIDVVFIDATSYLAFYKMSARELAVKVIALGNRNYSNSRNCSKSLSLQNCHGYCGKAHSCRPGWRPDSRTGHSNLQKRTLESSAHNGFLEGGKGNCPPP